MSRNEILRNQKCRFTGWISCRRRLTGWPKYLKAEDEMSSKIDFKKTDSFWSKS